MQLFPDLHTKDYYSYSRLNSKADIHFDITEYNTQNSIKRIRKLGWNYIVSVTGWCLCFIKLYSVHGCKGKYVWRQAKWQIINVVRR